MRRALITTALLATAALAVVSVAPAARTTLKPPSNLVASGGDQKVTLTWAASPSKSVAGYRVYRQNTDGTWPATALATTPAATTSYTDSGLTNGTAYTYRLTAIDGSSPPKESSPSASASATPAAAGSGPCGTVASPPSGYDHVVWVVMENHSYSQVIGSSSAPYTNQLAGQCGSASNFTAESHPSLPNYIAMTSGSTQGITDDNGPSSHPLNVPSIFSQAGTGGWRSLEESMPSNCDLSDSAEYAVRHNPAVYYTNIRTDCATRDVPLGSTPDLSARFTFVTPNLCDDTHDCSVQTGDTWLQGFLPKVFSSAEYAAGRTAVFLTWDEDDSRSGNHIATLVMAPSVKPGTVSSTAFNHYSMLRSTEEMLGLSPLLGGAASATSMRSAFNL
jgi:hypothetical protein